MSQSLDNFASSTADWRKSLRINNRKTIFILGIFFAIYLCLGLLVDCFIYSSHMPGSTISEILISIITFQNFPLATLVMLGVASFSVLVTFSFYDKLMLLGTEYHEITPTSAQNLAEKQLYNVIEEMKIASGLSFMPRVYIIEADYMNAFASGYSEKSAMIAITRGLMEKLNRSELQAVMAHELSHVRHLDIKVTLMASVLTNLIVMILDGIFYNLMYSRNSDSDNRSRNQLATIFIVLRYILPIINVLLLLYLSRTREYMADAGSVELLRDNQPLASALLKIQGDHTNNQAAYSAQYQQTPHENVRRESYFFDPIQAGIESVSSLGDMFSTHPNIKDRLAALGFKSKN